MAGGERAYSSDSALAWPFSDFGCPLNQVAELAASKDPFNTCISVSRIVHTHWLGMVVYTCHPSSLQTTCSDPPSWDAHLSPLWCPSPPSSLTLTSLVFPGILGPGQPQYFLLSPTASLGNAHYLLSPAPLPGGRSFPSLARAMGSRAGVGPWHSHVPFTVWAPASKSTGTQKRNPEAPSPCSVTADWGTLGNSVCQPIPTPSANCITPHSHLHAWHW